MRRLAGSYLRGLYARTMEQAYGFAGEEVSKALASGGDVLDCGAGAGGYLEALQRIPGFEKERYHGIEWNERNVRLAAKKGLDIRQGDLNRTLPFEDCRFDCVMGFSVIEHLLNGCHWLREAKRVLKPGGTLVILTPNISTYFTVALLLFGKMPTSGPHPDSAELVISEGLSFLAEHREEKNPDVEDDTPIHRHLVVFSYTALKRFLYFAGFEGVRGKGFGLYPFPNFLQPLLERIDPIHCHQMVFVAKKPAGSIVAAASGTAITPASIVRRA